MTYVDSVVLDLTEWACRRFQVLTGRTNVWLAGQLTNLSIVVYFVWAAMFFWNTDFTTRTLVGVFCGAVLYALTQTIFKVSIETSEAHAYRRVAKGLRNPRRIGDALLRISFLTLAVFLSAPVLFVYFNGRLLAPFHFHLQLVGLSYSLIVLTTVVLYVLACDPLPPCAGKVREWLRGLLPSRFAPSPSDVPAGD
jgi:hypothetical protein